MKKLMAVEYLSLDNVIDTPAWTAPFWSDEVAAFQAEQTGKADTLLLGRITYDGFSQAWPESQDPGAGYFNTVRKEVVTNSLEQLDWQNSHVLKPVDLPQQIRELKQGEGNILIYGSGQLVRALLPEGLIDELHLLLCPVTVGEGKKLFEGTPLNLQTLGSRTLEGGMTVLSFGPTDR